MGQEKKKISMGFQILKHRPIANTAGKQGYRKRVENNLVTVTINQ